MPKHAKETFNPEGAPQEVAEVQVPQQDVETFEIPGLAPDEGVIEEGLYAPEASDALNEVPFEIPDLVPDVEPVEARPLESTNPGVLGFDKSRHVDRYQKERRANYEAQRRQENIEAIRSSREYPESEHRRLSRAMGSKALRGGVRPAINDQSDERVM